ncbi:MFS transporter [Enemella evansiae]|uniref:MFS transporter n=1 Tax=Enemella evansiae TaxID=2016499 RepID=UPI0015C5B428|nr:MFS transporter [Enemella evansiae]
MVIATTTLLVVLDSTVVNVALPTIKAGLGFGSDGLEWVITAYTIAFGGLLLVGGRSGDLFGRRRMLVVGLLTFATASLVAGLAPSPGVLIAARFVQGTGAAIAAPAALSLIAVTFPAGPARNHAMSVYAMMSSGGGALGLIAGGLLTRYADWRWVFFVAVPIGLAAAAGATRALPETAPSQARLDLPGAVSITGGVAALVFALSRTSHGWARPTTLAGFGVAAALVLSFALIERRQPAPLLPGRVLADRARAVVYTVALIVGLALYALAFYLMLYLQQVLGYSSLQAGLAFLALAIPIAAAAIGMGRSIIRVGTRPGLIAGLLTAAVGALLLGTQAGTNANYVHLAIPLVILGLGLGATFVPLTLTALSTIQPTDAGVAAALVSAGQQIGASVGLALLGSLAHSVTQRQTTHWQAALDQGYRSTFYATAALLAIGFILTAALLPKRANAE